MGVPAQESAAPLRLKPTQSVVVVPPRASVMAIVMTVFEPVMGIVVPIPQVAEKAAMVAPSDAIPMGPVVPVLDSVVAAVMPLFEAIMLATMIIARSVLRRRRRRHSDRDR